MPTQTLILVVLIACMYVMSTHDVKSQNQINSCEWEAFGGIPIGLGGEAVYDITTNLSYSAPGIYIAGEIDMAGDKPVNNIVMWDGTSFHDLDGGVNGPIYDIEMDSTSNPAKLLVAGDFSMAGGIPANNVAIWDGSQWSSIGVGVENGVNGVARAIDYSYNCHYYIGGEFDQAGTTSANNIAAWDGTSWSAMSTGITGGFVPTVYSIAVLNNIDCASTSVYAGGRFTTAGGVASNNIAVYNGGNWSPLGTSLSNGVNNIVFDIEVAYYNSNVGIFVAGAFNQAGGIPAFRLANWDGLSWSGLGNLTSGFVFDIEISYSVGHIFGGEFEQIGGIAANNVAVFDGSSWSAFGTGAENGTTGRVNAVYEDYPMTEKKYVGGDLGQAGTTPASQVAYWEAGQLSGAWHNFSEGNGLGVNFEIKEFAHDSQGLLYAVGDINNAGEVSTKKIAVWDGTQWSALSDDEFDFDINNIVIDANDNIYISGGFTRINGVVYNRIAMWNGSGWINLDNGTFSGQIHDIALDENQQLYAVGSFTNMGSTTARRIARWDGSSWHSVGVGLEEGLNGTVYAISFTDDGTLFVGGDFSEAGTVGCRHIASWDGSSWVSLSNGVNARVNALVTDGANVYVGGRFTKASGLTVNQIATWDGASWINMEDGITSANGSFPEIYDIAVSDNGDVYVVGEFRAMSNLYSPRIARWDGVDWQTVMSHCDQPFEEDDRVLTCHVTDTDQLYVGGSFIEVMGQISRGISSYNTADFPVALCKDISVELDVDGTYTIDPNELDDGSYATCGASGLFLINVITNVFTCEDLGDQVLVLGIAGLDCNNSFCESVVTVADPFGYCCPLNLYAHPTPLVDGDYQAMDKVHSDQIVPQGGDVSFQAESSICLDPGFEVEVAGAFEALIEVCQ